MKDLDDLAFFIFACCFCAAGGAVLSFLIFLGHALWIAHPDSDSHGMIVSGSILLCGLVGMWIALQAD